MQLLFRPWVLSMVVEKVASGGEMDRCEIEMSLSHPPWICVMEVAGGGETDG